MDGYFLGSMAHARHFVAMDWLEAPNNVMIPTQLITMDVQRFV